MQYVMLVLIKIFMYTLEQEGIVELCFNLIYCVEDIEDQTKSDMFKFIQLARGRVGIRFQDLDILVIGFS